MWANPADALAKYLDEKDDLQAGREVRRGEGTTIADLADEWLDDQRARVQSKELALRTWGDYRRTAQTVVDILGPDTPADSIKPSDFQRVRERLTKGRGVHALRREITHVRMMFTWGFESELLPVQVRFGPSFKQPGKRAMKRHRNEQEKKLIAAEHIRQLLPVADVKMRAMILLGINCGFGNTDVATLPRRALLYVDGHAFLDFPRPKTGEERRCPLWPETELMLRLAMTVRVVPKDPADAGLVFLTRTGARYVRVKETEVEDGDSKITNIDIVAQTFKKLLKGREFDRRGLNFYVLRHTFETIAGDSADQVATDFMMGHSDQSMAATYREKIFEHRLLKVAEHVRHWLLPNVSPA
ncbi:tyrosine-type recombinase/integrase [Stratiformator vulcanicus]|uniref:tyrosine-type recombinase/integrase n=1 Tax=Stratiformator vulcanicus TaxID=2527980 RepID=UPI0028781188|nr:hypothetical protein [Stratiformator vulcanicus]